MSTPTPDLDALLSHAAWIEQLGRQLCRDEHRAADAAQETWLAALRMPPQHHGNLRGFLAARLRNALRLGARGETRRARREGEVAATGFAEAAADAAARAETHRFLLQQVLALPEPQRALVLLHYYEGERIKDVARRTGLTVDAVHAHLKRARTTLRTQLRSSDGPARAGFLLLLASSPPPLVLLALLAMKTKLAISAAAALAVAWFAWPFATTRDALSPTTSEAVGRLQSASTPVLTGTAAGDGEVALRMAAATSVGGPGLRCQLVGIHPEAPWTAPVQVDLEGRNNGEGRSERDRQQSLPSSDGAFTIVLPAWADTCTEFAATFRAEDDHYLALEVHERAPSFVQSRLAARGTFELSVQVVSVLTGRVVDDRGDPVPAARVAALPLRIGRPYGGPRPQTNTAVDGTFRLAAPVATDVLVVAIPMHEASPGGNREVGRHGAIPDCHRLRDDLLAASSRASCRFGGVHDVGTLALRAATTITGEVREGGRPVAGAGVDWWWTGAFWSGHLDDLSVRIAQDGRVHVVAKDQPNCTTDADGRFSFHAPPGWSGKCRLSLQHAPGPWPSSWCVETFVSNREVTAPAHVAFDLAPSIVVQVRRGGRPVEHAAFYHVPMSGDSPKLTNASGEVRFLRDRAEAAQLQVRAPGASMVVVDVPADACPERPIVVEFDDAPRVRLRLEVEGEPRVHSLSATLASKGQPGAYFGGELTRAEGGGPFELLVPPGRYGLELTAPRRGGGDDSFVCRLRQRDVSVGPGDTDLRVRVQHGGRIAVDALAATTGVRLGAEVRLFTPDGKETKPSFYTEVDGASAPGRLLTTGLGESLEVLVPGRYELVLDFGARGVHRRTVDVRAREVAEVKIRLP